MNSILAGTSLGRATIAVLGSLALLVGACGGSAGPSPASSVAASAPPTATAAAGLLGEVRARGVLRVANTQANPPFNYLNDKNQLVGFDVDIANEIAKRIGVPKVEFVGSNFASFIPGVQTNKFDIVIAGQTITEERKLQVGFSEPYEVNGVSIFVAEANATIKAVDDLKGKRIGVTAGTTNEKFARTIAGAEVKTYENATLAMTDLGLGRVDAVLFSRFTGTYLAQQNNLKVKATPGFLTKEINAMSFRLNEPAFKAEVDRALASMIADGTLTRISTTWLGGLDMAAELKAAR